MNRRSLITGLVALVAAPAIVRAGSLMPVKLMLPDPLSEYGLNRLPTSDASASTITLTGMTGKLRIGDSISWGRQTARIVAQIAGDPCGDGTYQLDRFGSGIWPLNVIPQSSLIAEVA